MKFMGFEVSGIPAKSPPGSPRVVDKFDLRDAAIECARLMHDSGNWRGVMCQVVTLDGESETKRGIAFLDGVPA